MSKNTAKTNSSDESQSSLDITSSHLAEEDTKIARDALDLRVLEQTAELSTMNEALRVECRRLQQLLDLHEQERQLVALDIHDGMMQDLTASLLFFEAVTTPPSDISETTKRDYEKGLSLLRKAMEEARQIINGLRPTVLEQQGLIAAIESLIAQLPADPPIDLQFECDISPQHLAPTLETAIYRIIQEGLTNVRKHSGAKQAKVTLLQNDSGIEIIVQDWGDGFATHQEKADRRGLRGIRERARFLGGSVRVDSKPGEGTRLYVCFPASSSPRSISLPPETI